MLFSNDATVYETWSWIRSIFRWTFRFFFGYPELKGPFADKEEDGAMIVGFKCLCQRSLKAHGSELEYLEQFVLDILIFAW